MITSTTIEKVCLQEESYYPDTKWKQDRVAWLEQQLESGGGLIKNDFQWIGTERCGLGDRIQLACEAIKFHRLRLSGLDLHQALDRMFC